MAQIYAASIVVLLLTLSAAAVCCTDGAVGGTGSGQAPDTAQGKSGVNLQAKAIAAVALFLEASLGLAIPLFLTQHRKSHWLLSLVNCFSGGVFFAVGMVHLLPDCFEAAAKLQQPFNSQQAALSLVVAGYCLIFFMERVLFNLHEHDHQHCHHTTHVPLLPCSTYTHWSKQSSTESLHMPLLLHLASEDGLQLPIPEPDGALLLPAGGSSTAEAQGSQGQHQEHHSSHQQPCTSASAQPNGVPYQPHHHHHCHHSLNHILEHHPELLDPHRHSLRYRHALMLMLALGAHTALESLALGFLNDWHSFSVLLGAIASHKLISAMALSTRFLKEGATPQQVVVCAGELACCCSGASPALQCSQPWYLQPGSGVHAASIAADPYGVVDHAILAGLDM
jgi:zinc transporter ZupT